MANNQGFFEPCWRPIYPDSGGPVERQDFTTPNRHPLSQLFHDKLGEIAALHDLKQADYGRDADPFYNVRKSQEWGISPWVGAMVRADDKIGRLRNLSQNGGHLKNESVQDSLQDIAVYALIALVLFEEETQSVRSAQA